MVKTSCLSNNRWCKGLGFIFAYVVYYARAISTEVLCDYRTTQINATTSYVLFLVWQIIGASFYLPQDSGASFMKIKIVVKQNGILKNGKH